MAKNLPHFARKIGIYVLAIALAFTSFLWTAPILLESLFSPWVLSDGHRVSFKCQNLNFWSLDCNQITWFGPKSQGQIESVSIHFNGLALLQHNKIELIEISGANIEGLVLDQNTETSTGLPVDEIWTQTFKSILDTPGQTMMLPSQVQHLRLKDISIQAEGRSIYINKAVISLESTKRAYGNLEWQMDGVPFETHFSADLPLLEVDLQLKQPSIARDALAMKLHGHFDLSLAEFHQSIMIGSGEHRLNIVASANLLGLRGRAELLSPQLPNQPSFMTFQWQPQQSLSGIWNSGDHQQSWMLHKSSSGYELQSEGSQQQQYWTFDKTVQAKFHHAPWSRDNLVCAELFAEWIHSDPFQGLSFHTSRLDVGVGQIKNIALNFPVGLGQVGFLKGNMEFSNIASELNLKILRQHQGWSISGNLLAPNLPFPPVAIELNFGWDQNILPRFNVQAGWPKQSIAIRPDEFISDGPDGSLQITVSTNIACSWSITQGWQEYAKVQWQDGFFSNDDFSMMATGLSGRIESDQLSHFATGPAQEFSWKSLQGHGFHCQEGQLFWQWEKEQRMFIESLRAGWCGGKITIQPIRLIFPIDSLNLSLFCEKLKLDDLLREFQVGDVEGEGELGGHISVSITPEKMIFKDAYLYTAPSVVGRLQVKASQVLDLMANRDDQPQLRLVREAMRDYSYEWARLQFDAEGHDLVLRLTMDGKPNHLLPFHFEETTGLFSYNQSGAGVHLQGLKVNTNLKSSNLWPLIQSTFKWSQKFEF